MGRLGKFNTKANKKRVIFEEGREKELSGSTKQIIKALAGYTIYVQYDTTRHDTA